MRQTVQFEKALPVWLAGCADKMNTAARFVASVPRGYRSATLRITASSLYRFWIDGQFGGFGPARAAHGHFRIDEWPVNIPEHAGGIQVSIEAVGCNINSYYWPMHSAFLQAELVSNDEILAATGMTGFNAFEWTDRVQRVERYSAARTFSEVYRLGTRPPVEHSQVEILPQPSLLPRRLPYPHFEMKPPAGWIREGTMKPFEPEALHRDWTLDCIGPDLLGYPESELETIPSLAIQHFKTVGSAQTATSGPASRDLEPLAFGIAGFERNISGFISLTVSCETPTTLYATFDEILINDDVDWKRLRCNNIITLMLQPGRHEFESIEPYSFQYLKLMPVDARCRIERIRVREYAAPADFQTPPSLRPGEDTLFKAAVETYRQNAVDLLTDCPSRERAGWLCDSFFTARTEHFLTGASVVEHAFLENYRLHNQARYLPEGMLPMCYPADHPNGKFIPNWALWYILQLEEFTARTRRQECERHLQLVEGVLGYFDRYRNTDGLLESLDGWIFVEWSAANEFVQDVNFPTNMLYAAALDAASRLTQSPEFSRTAEAIRKKINRQSFDGEWFCDNAIRSTGNLARTDNRTEVCQYYAFYFGVASPASHPELWHRLVTEFGPDRGRKALYPEIHSANALNGIMLRMELLARNGLHEQLRKELLAYYLPMAEMTGTLWEHSDASASCCHGFQSYAGVLLAKISG